MVMALKHQIDPARVEYRLPGGLDLGRVIGAGAGEDGLVEQHDIPCRLARRQRSVQPPGLRRHGAQVDGRCAVHDDEAHALIIDEIGCPDAGRAIVGQRELQGEIGTERAAFPPVGQRHVDIFMIAGRGQLRNDGPVIAPRLIEFAPFVVMVQIVALGGKVAGMQDEVNAAIGMKGLTDDPAGIGQDAVLDVTQIEEAKGLRLRGGGAELQPFAPARAAFQPIGVGGVGRQVGETDLVIEGRAIGAVLARAGLAADRAGLPLERGAIDRDRDLRLARCLGDVGAETDRHAAGRVCRGRQHDPVGQAARGIRGAGRPGHRGLRRGLRHCRQRRHEQQRRERKTDHARPFMETGLPAARGDRQKRMRQRIRSWPTRRTSPSNYIPHIAAGGAHRRNSDTHNIWRC